MSGNELGLGFLLVLIFGVLTGIFTRLGQALHQREKIIGLLERDRN